MMENQDKLYEQFQQASQKAEKKDFPAMDKVWGRVEEKLDHKVLKNENKLWKKIAIAASFLLIFTLGYHVFKDSSETVVPENEVVTTEIKKANTPAPTIENEEKTESPSLIEEKQAEKIINSKIKTQEHVVIVENKDSNIEEPVADVREPSSTSEDQKHKAEKNTGSFQTRKFNTVGVQNRLAVKEKADDSFTEEQTVKKQNPLFVIDGKAIVNKNNTEYETLLSKNISDANDIDSFQILKEPLYIINDIEYSEEELFGSNPTSPYFPLDKQEIVSTTILLEQEATPIYGEKGKKGVVIITTKNGKPLQKQ